jgi:hypothetical protein
MKRDTQNPSPKSALAPVKDARKTSQDQSLALHDSLLKGVHFTSLQPANILEAGHRYVAENPDADDIAQVRRSLSGLPWLYFETRMSERAPGPDDRETLKGDPGADIVFHPEVRLCGAALEDAHTRDETEINALFDTAGEPERDILVRMKALSISPANLPLVNAAHALLIRGALKTAKIVNVSSRMHRPTAQILVDGVLIVRDYTAIRSLLRDCRVLGAHTLCLVQGPGEGPSDIYETQEDFAAIDPTAHHSGVRLSCLSLKSAIDPDQVLEELDGYFAASPHSIEAIMALQGKKVAQAMKNAMNKAEDAGDDKTS